MAQRIGERAPSASSAVASVTAAGSPRDLGGETRPRQHGDLGLGRGLGHDLRDELAVFCSMPFEQITSGRSRLRCGASSRDRARMLGRRRQQEKVAVGDFAQAAGGADRGIEADAREIGLVAVVLGKIGERFRLIGPDRNVAAGAFGRDGKSRAPRARANDAD